MDQIRPLPDAEKAALNVFHDLQLAHVRDKQGAPERAARLRVSAKGNILEGDRDSLSCFRTASHFQAGRPRAETSR
jgi:hypothetical protein